jgi:UDP-hydrolysing UDP-N-acetyl-D-glucosamine 2-epimerase
MGRSITSKRRICFVTGARAEFGLMRSALDAIRLHPSLQLQLVATGMHLDPAHGRGLASIADQGFTVDAVVPWPAGSGKSPTLNAAHTGQAIAHLARTFGQLRSDIVLIVGDRVEAFAAAAAAHLSHRAVAHVHGGDRAMGQIDDSLRHAITKLAHIHFPATAQSARRLARLGEDPWRIFRVGSPGIDGIRQAAASWPDIAAIFPDLAKNSYAILLLHPADADSAVEQRRAACVFQSLQQSAIPRLLVLYPNNDPGSAGIIACWRKLARGDRFIVRRDLPRPIFLGLLRHAAVLAGNSSSGIIEAATFATPVLDIGPRQAGRQRSANVIHCDYNRAALVDHWTAIWNHGRPRRATCRNVYGGQGAGRRLADSLARIDLDHRLRLKLIRY